MPPKKKTDAEKLAEAELTNQLMAAHLMGLSYRKIQEKMGINRQKALRIITETKEKMVQEQTKLQVADHLAEELARIKLLIVEAFEGWHRSYGKMRETMKDSGYTEKSGDYSKTKVKRWTQAGDPRFISVIKELMVERNRLLGMYEVVTGTKGSGAKGGASLTKVELHHNVYFPGLGHLTPDQMTQFLQDIEATLDDAGNE